LVGEEFDGDVDVSLLFFLKGVALEASGPALDFPGLESPEDDLNPGQGAQGFDNVDEKWPGVNVC
jgi:hypothetical protein